jgi:hypothetical protein
VTAAVSAVQCKSVMTAAVSAVQCKSVVTAAVSAVQSKCMVTAVALGRFLLELLTDSGCSFCLVSVTGVLCAVVCVCVCVCFISVKSTKVLYKMYGFEIKTASDSPTQVFIEW